MRHAKGRPFMPKRRDKTSHLKFLRLVAIAVLVGAVGAFVGELLRPRRIRSGYHPRPDESPAATPT